jgi:hypothetical protein
MAKLSRPIAALLLGIASQTLKAADATSMLGTRVKAAVYQLHTGYNSATDDCGGLDKPIVCAAAYRCVQRPAAMPPPTND